MSKPASPTSAIALEYDREAGRLPHVVATGRGKVAERIVEMARAAGVPVEQNPDLASLLATVELGEDIPSEALVAVAEVLAALYRLNDRMKRERAPLGQS